MAKISIQEHRVHIGNTVQEDTAVGRNENSDVNDKVQAFVDCFGALAKTASAEVHGLPAAFILAQWGAESGWGANVRAAENQNWGMLKAGGAAHSKGRDARGFSIFYGKNTFKDAYVYILNHVSNYEALRRYLHDTQAPTVNACIALIANSGYCEGAPQAYSDLLTNCVATLRKRSDFFTQR
ncbi:MAG: hypothetical protein RSF70_09270 [Ruthenibacterium sp.]